MGEIEDEGWSKQGFSKCPEVIEKLALQTYKLRLQNREMREELTHSKNDKEELCQLRLKMAQQKKTPPWTLQNLEVVLKYLKKNKSRDPLGFANEIFQSNVAGNDLKLAILKLVNRIKSEQVYPSAFESCNISSIYKNKKSRNSFDNYRGIFRVPIFPHHIRSADLK